MSGENKVDVLIIGAGPAGLMCANALASSGISVRIIDKRPIKVSAGQADGIQPRTIEVLQSYGLADRLLREGNQMHLAAFYNPSPKGGIERTSRAYDVTAPTSSRFPFEVTLHQGAIENIFRDSMREHGLRVEQNTSPVSLELSDDPKDLQDPQSYAVKVVLKRLNNEQTSPTVNNVFSNANPQNPKETEVGDTEVIRAKYVVGCDGAHSWVRSALGIKLKGESTEYIWGVVDTIPETDFPDIRNRTVIHSNNGSCMVIPREGDKVRLYVQLAEAPVDQSGRLDKSKMGAEKVMEVAQKSFAPFKLTFPHDIEWWTLYIIGQRVASTFHSHNRVFIAGDACHTHSPKAGQGMNASMNDTHNLAWKLVWALRGWASAEKLLGTYELERRKYAQDLIEFDRKFSAVFSGKPWTEDNPDGVSHEQFLQVFQTFGGFTSGIGIHYQDSVITSSTGQTAASKLIVGQRLLPQTIIRSADGRPFEIQDLAKSNHQIKLFLFVGNTNEISQRKKIEHVAGELRSAILQKYGEDAFDVITFSNVPKAEVDYTNIPAFLRSHWSKVFTDDETFSTSEGGKLYESYGVSSSGGAIVVVRPDGYIGFVTFLDKVEELGNYLKQFMISRQ